MKFVLLFATLLFSLCSLSAEKGDRKPSNMGPSRNSFGCFNTDLSANKGFDVEGAIKANCDTSKPFSTTIIPDATQPGLLICCTGR